MIACSFPGRAGDLLWALPTVRAISEGLGEPVGLQIAGEFEGMIPLLRQQPYLIAQDVWADQRWGLTPPNEWDAPPWIGDRTPERVLHLGYRGWPQVPLPLQTYSTAHQHYSHLVTMAPLDLKRPWINRFHESGYGVTAAFTDEWVELKAGVAASLPLNCIVCPVGSRWLEWREVLHQLDEGDWMDLARDLSEAKVALCCCSAPHVLAVALGTPVVLVEPSEARQNPIFYPVGMDGPQVTVVRGSDGNFTFDARAVAKALKEALGEAHR